MKIARRIPMLKKTLNIVLLTSFLAILCNNYALAQSPLTSSDSDSPIEISAEESLQWLQDKKQYVANGAVIVSQDDMTLNADQLVADYDENSDDSLNITILTATGNVIIKDAENTATGDKVTYDLQTEEIVLTGETPTLVTPEQTISASEKLTYNMQLGTAEAIGNAKIQTAKETLEATKITANLSKPEEGKKQQLTSAKATGGIKITTKDETITGKTGTYDAIKNTAAVNGNVKIKRGPNILEGARATVNLNTNISQIFGNETTGKRVKGVFFPKSK